MNRDLFEEARQSLRVIDHPAVVAMKLKQEGASWRGPCPLCNASQLRYDKGEKRAGAFSVDVTGRRWKCYGCTPRSSDVIDLEHRLYGNGAETTYHAVQRILGFSTTMPSKRSAEDEAKDIERAEKKARFIRETALALWRDGKPSQGTPVEVYLRSRGFSGPVLARALEMLRYHPNAYHSGAGRNTKSAPAMIGLIMTPYGPTGGVSVTYLARGGMGKSTLSPSRKVFGPEKKAGPDGTLVYGGVWLAPPDSPGQLIVGEGIETVGSAAILFGEAARPVATLGLQSLQGLWATDEAGQVDFTNLQPATDCPAFTWPNPPNHPWDGPIICIDRDMAPIRVKTKQDGRSEYVDLDAGSRAAICATLASAAWLGTGVSGCAFAIPPSDMDLNDQLRAALVGVAAHKLHISMLEFFASDLKPTTA